MAGSIEDWLSVRLYNLILSSLGTTRALQPYKLVVLMTQRPSFVPCKYECRLYCTPVQLQQLIFYHVPVHIEV